MAKQFVHMGDAQKRVSANKYYLLLDMYENLQDDFNILESEAKALRTVNARLIEVQKELLEKFIKADTDRRFSDGELGKLYNKITEIYEKKEE